MASRKECYNMTNYVFIESRDPFESRDAGFVADTATALKGGLVLVLSFY
jgi:hypothetical protein